MIQRPFTTLSAAACAAGLLTQVAVAEATAAAAADMLPGQDEIHDTATAVVETASVAGIDALLPRLRDKRVVFVGESHDRYEDHLNQLRIIRGLHEQGHDLAIGMEFFQRPFQPVLDAFIAGEISEAALLRQTEYFTRWRFDYRLYRPILRFAREHGIPLIALNLPKEITDQVGDGGIDSLSPEQAALIPADIDRDDAVYRERVEAVFALHPKDDDADFEHFMEVQLLWDEGMAERAADYLQAHPDKTLVVLAGTGHVEYGHGIPQRVARRIDVPAATVVSGNMRPFDPGLADYILYPQRVELPATGLLGVMLDTDSEGEGLGVQGFSEDSGAKAAGVEEGDRIVSVGDSPIDSYADIRIALMDSRPGEVLPVEVLREKLIGGKERLSFEVELH
ncbi:ChaN family lipoprotein [uncultured Thiohalocapsa sp.]|uniref:ChaN family lipoprotein n=1 Tax=uncultured Thiohalocapsa sp. TaxID=768990 RepID=UPI0025E025CB|nr:ChaN family lipoprotein [uncultured Thiohalocapsa sp.]